MRQRILGSVITAALLTTSTYADDTLMQRFEKMEREMAALKAEINAIKAENSKLSTQLSTPVSSHSKTEVASADKLDETLEEIQDQLDDLNKKTNGNNLKFGVDFRTSLDNIQYKMADGSKQENDALLSNRLWLNMSYAATKNLSFVGQLAYNKFFGERAAPTASSAMDGFDWVSGESA
ncbi:MAG TPA: DUF3373 family protein, partial [Sulfuricurvum sp.]|nr:DUF3373 family protein [Sulfuricurvum sp.]